MVQSCEEPESQRPHGQREAQPRQHPELSLAFPPSLLRHQSGPSWKYQPSQATDNCRLKEHYMDKDNFPDDPINKDEKTISSY